MAPGAWVNSVDISNKDGAISFNTSGSITNKNITSESIIEIAKPIEYNKTATILEIINACVDIGSVKVK